jgi:hypothetical protein
MTRQFKGWYDSLLSPMAKNGIHPQGHVYFDSSSEHTTILSLLKKVIELQAQHDEVGFVKGIKHKLVACRTKNHG